ncbi:outer membrane beta-barrel protein [Rhodomicrobium sp. Az07]|uniref:outer membrane protein n=1 Tax=Rhodomicrobium sp. Az07 TaxID=2839034 RepID=UPI001BEA8DF2|nr:outer membrane beta-barrel protein [Rhodomicrobium sp. Az07]MBT3070973.1 outer membrane beta-barrel protein [Rhodomicrobium sp. Az07]
MKKTILAAASVAALIGVSGSALAADMYSKGGYKDAPVMVPEPTWTGFYLGLGLGAAAVNHDIDYSEVWARDNKNVSTRSGGGRGGNHRQPEDLSAGLDGISGTGAFGTVEVGYDRQFGSVVAGVFFNYDFADVGTDAHLNGDKATLDLEDSWTVGGRIGYLVNASTLAYVLGGYTEANFEAKAGEFKWDDTLNGWTVGGGLETKLGGNWFLKAEYRYTEFDGLTFKGGDERGCYVSAQKLDVDTSVQTARVVLSYKADLFGGSVDPLK